MFSSSRHNVINVAVKDKLRLQRVIYVKVKKQNKPSMRYSYSLKKEPLMAMKSDSKMQLMNMSTLEQEKLFLRSNSFLMRISREWGMT